MLSITLKIPLFSVEPEIFMSTTKELWETLYSKRDLGNNYFMSQRLSIDLRGEIF